MIAGRMKTCVQQLQSRPATIDYLAMMADIDIPTEDKNEMGGVDDE